MADNLKGDIVNEAFARCRISGLTSNPTPTELAKGLRRLESMAAEFSERNICVGYNFEDDPDFNTPHNIERKFWDAFETNLSTRILADFGKEPSSTLAALSAAGLSYLHSGTISIDELQYPATMARGRGNTRGAFRYNRYYTPKSVAPVSCETKKMYVGETEDYIEPWSWYLKTGEDIDTFEIDVDDGLTLGATSNDTPDISYNITADTDESASYPVHLQAKMTITTTDSRVKIAVIDFEISEP